ncbi:hypothetical protein LshimejAT787_0605960 [Lyophyllum shimeji]|uniref:DUF6533 domain-containing protein n=1 Tax=Lyophyllum shimeji TaxID=47721 RepID=A0A9P3PQ02_LYOSH|nr:hypothetical protein LshimejAT787_0605960 [Lyophyllum shimeji]
MANLRLLVHHAVCALASGPQPLSPVAMAALAKSAYHLSVSKYYALAATVMLLYDTVLTFDREVEGIWRSRWTGVKVLFFFNRYANIFAYLAALIAINSTWPPDPFSISRKAVIELSRSCARYVHFPGIFNLVQQVVIGAVLILFTWALFSRSWAVVVIAVITLVVQLVVTGWSLGAVTAVPLPRGFVGCIYAGKRGTGIRIQTAWFMQLVFISVVFGLMIWRAAKLRKADVKAPLIVIITRDGLKYFGLIFSVNFVNVMNFTLVKDPSLKSLHATFSALLTVIVINRMILSVREEVARPTHGNSSYTEPGPSTTWVDAALHYEPTTAPESGHPMYCGASRHNADAYEMPRRDMRL